MCGISVNVPCRTFQSVWTQVNNVHSFWTNIQSNPENLNNMWNHTRTTFVDIATTFLESCYNGTDLYELLDQVTLPKICDVIKNQVRNNLFNNVAQQNILEYLELLDHSCLDRNYKNKLEKLCFEVYVEKQAQIRRKLRSDPDWFPRDSQFTSEERMEAITLSLSSVEKIFNEVQHSIIYYLSKVVIAVMTDVSFRIGRLEIHPSTSEFQTYHLEILPTGNKIIDVVINNVTLRKVYLYLNNHHVSLLVQDSHFIESGLTINSEPNGEPCKQISIQHCDFSGDGSQTFLQILSTENVFVWNSHFYDLNVREFPLITAFESEIEITNSSFINCSTTTWTFNFLGKMYDKPPAGFDHSVILQSVNSLIRIINSTFERNANSLAVLASSNDSKSTILNSKFTNSSLLFCSNSFLELIDTNIANETGGAIFALECSVNIESSRIVNIVNNKDFNNLIDLRFTNFSMSDSIIKKNSINSTNAGVFSLSSGYTVIITRSHFSDNINLSGCGVFCAYHRYNLFTLTLDVTNIITVQVLNSTFARNYVQEAVVDLGPFTKVSFGQCKFYDNNAGHGAVVSTEGSSIQLNDCSIVNNSAIEGGFLLSNTSFEKSQRTNISFINCKINGNTAVRNGGVLLFASEMESVITFSNCLITNNYAGSNGAVGFLVGAKVIFNGCSFKNNQALESGGIIFSKQFRSTSTLPWKEKIARNSNITFDRCVMTNNSAHQHGGVLSSRNSVTTITDCFIVDNYASHDGGVCFVEFSSSLTIQNSLFDSNSCAREGGVIKTYRRTKADISNSTFVHNKSFQSSGGTIFMEDSCYIVSRNNEFSNSKASSKGGAVFILDHSSFNDTRSLFKSNIASDIGKFNILS